MAPALLLATILFGLTGLAPARAADSPHDRATLVGLTAVFVDVQPLDPAGLLAGLAPDAIKDELDVKLRLAGLRVIVGADEDVPPQERGVLQVNVSVVPVPKQDGTYAYSVYVAMLQGAVLVRDMKTILATPTWWVTKTGIGDVKQIKAAINDGGDRFVTAWRAVESATKK
jgi:hypothetical protein